MDIGVAIQSLSAQGLVLIDEAAQQAGISRENVVSLLVKYDLLGCFRFEHPPAIWVSALGLCGIIDLSQGKKASAMDIGEAIHSLSDREEIMIDDVLRLTGMLRKDVMFLLRNYHSLKIIELRKSLGVEDRFVIINSGESVWKPLYLEKKVTPQE